MSKIRVTRTLVYEGEENDILTQLGSSYLYPTGPIREISYGRGTMKELPRKKEKLLSPAEEAWEIKSKFISSGYHETFIKKIKETFIEGFNAGRYYDSPPLHS